MKEIFADHGVPNILQSNNDPQYASAAFLKFAAEWGFEHIISNLHYPASNGFAESIVKIVKTAFTKAKYSGGDPQLALLTLYSTSVVANLPSSTQLLFQCKLKTRLLTQPGNTDPCAEDHQRRLSEKVD